MLEMFCYVAREKQNIYFQRELINNVGFSNNTNASFLKQCLCVTRYIKHMKESQSTLTEQSSLLRCNNNNKKKSEGKSVKQKHTAHKFISDALIPELFVRDWIIPVGYWTASCTNHI